MKWCCDGFRNFYNQRHDRGLLVFATPPVIGTSNEPSFHIASRATERNNFDSVGKALKGMSVHLALNCSTGMRYCPWCGATLKKFYSKSWPELIDQRVIDEFIFV